MPSLSSLLPFTGPVSTGSGTETASPATDKAAEPFDHVMNRAIGTPPSAKRKISPQKPFLSGQPLKTTASDSPQTETEDEKNGTGPGNIAGKKNSSVPRTSAVVVDPTVVADAASAEPIQIIASTLSAFLGMPAGGAPEQKQEGKTPTVFSAVPSVLTPTPSAEDSHATVAKQTTTAPDAKPLAQAFSTKAEQGAMPIPMPVEKQPEPKPFISGSEASIKSTVADPASVHVPMPAVAEPADNAETAIAPDATAKFTVHPSSESYGTSVAKEDTTMKKTENTTKVAGQNEKVLPLNVVSMADEKNLPARHAARPASGVIVPLDATTVTAPYGDNSPAPANNVSSDTVTSIVDIRAKVVERTHDMVALHVVRLKELNTDSLQVVLKPGAGTQLSLELRQRDGIIEAQAVMQQGDFHLLKEHWPELQQRLDEKGIRLAALIVDEHFTAGNNFFQQQQQQSRDQDSLYAGAFAEVSLAGTLTAPLAQQAARTIASRGWESWA